jgi:hypothetical protein
MPRSSTLLRRFQKSGANFFREKLLAENNKNNKYSARTIHFNLLTLFRKNIFLRRELTADSPSGGCCLRMEARSGHH